MHRAEPDFRQVKSFLRSRTHALAPACDPRPSLLFLGPPFLAWPTPLIAQALA